MSLLTLTTSVRTLLDDPKHWTQRAWALDSNKHPVTSSSPAACCWCLQGAVLKCSRALGADMPCLARWIEVWRRVMGKYGSAVQFNDSTTTTHKDVLSGLDKMIEWLKANPDNT